MKGVYLTQEGKQEIEAKIANLKKPAPHWDGIYVSEKAEERVELYEEILSSAIVLPVEEDWYLKRFPPYTDFLSVSVIEGKYPNGVIIQPKQ